MVGALLAIGSVYLWQTVLADAERRDLEWLLNEQYRALEKAKAAESDQERLHEEIRAYRLSKRDLRRIIPETLAVEAYLQTVHGIADRHGVEVVSAEPRLFRGEYYDRAEIRLSLRGDSGRTGAAILEMCRAGALVGAEDLEHRGGTTNVSLRRFAVAPLDDPRRLEPCDLEPSAVWFPGLRGELDTLRAETESVCASVASMIDYVDQVHALEDLREEVQFLSSILSDLAPQYVAPSTPEQVEAFGELIARVHAELDGE